MTLTPEGGAAIPVSVTTTRKVQGGSAIPVYGYMTAPTDGRPAMGGAAIPVRVLTAADLKQNGGQWTLEGRPHAMPVYTAPATTTVMGGPALAVYPVNAWPTVTPVVPPAFVPTDIAGLLLWLKADGTLWQDSARTTLATADADVVGCWDDASGNANHVAAPAAANRPALKLNIKNGKPILRFATDDVLQHTLTYPQAFTVFAVCVWSDATAFAGPVGGDAENWVRVFQLRRNTTGPVAEFLVFDTVPNAFTDNQAITPTNWNILSAVRRANECQVYVNGTGAAATATAGTPTSGDSYVLVGAPYGTAAPGLPPNTWAQFFTGDIGEILIYNTALSAANQQAVEACLNTRWAVY